jgi:hypothetical protein
MAKRVIVAWHEMPWYDNVVEAASLQAYFACTCALNQEHRTERDVAYERDYRPLQRRIAKVLTAHGVPSERYFVFDVWVPNRAREVSIEGKCLTPEIVTALCALLRNKYARWRIDVGLMGSLKRYDVRGMISLHDHWVLCFGAGRKVIDKVRKLHQ